MGYTYMYAVCPVYYSFVYGSNGEAVQYTNWYGSEEPDDGAGYGSEDCVIMYVDPYVNMWLDFTCQLSCPVVCEKTDDEVAPWPTSNFFNASLNIF
jgi:hypothetical protein